MIADVQAMMSVESNNAIAITAKNSFFINICVYYKFLMVQSAKIMYFPVNTSPYPNVYRPIR